MRLSARICTCSVAALIGAACTGTTITEGQSKGGSTGYAGDAQTTRSSGSTSGNTGSGNGGYTAAHAGGDANWSSAGNSATTATGGGRAETGGSGGAANSQVPAQGAFAGDTDGKALGGNSARAGSSATTGGTKPIGGAGGASTSSQNTSAAAAGGPTASGGALATGGAATGGAATGGAATGGAATGGVAGVGGIAATGGTSTSSAPPVPAPSITTVSPSSGIVTTTVIISGQDFGAQQGTSTVTIAGSAVTPTYWSNTSIEAPIPRSVYPGPAQITVTVAGKLSNNASFDVLLPRTVYINRSDRTSTSGNSVAGFALSQYGFTTLPNSPYVSGDSGTNGGSDDNSLALHRATRRLFVANDYSVSAFDIDPVTGELKRTPNCPVSTGGGAGASGIVVNAAGNLVFVSNLCSTADNCRYVNPQISAFTVSPTGILTPVNGSPFKQAAASGGVMNPALIHNDQFLVVTDDAYRPPYNNLIVNSVNAATGALTFATAFEAGTISSSARADPTGMWYYVDDSNIAAKLYGFSFQNSGTPALTSGMPVATKTTSTQPNSMAISVDGSHLYLGSYDSNEVSVFTLNAGVATLMEESPRLLEGVSTITTLGISRNKSQLVVADSSTQALIVYPVNSGVPHIAGLGNTFDIGRASGLVVSE